MPFPCKVLARFLGDSSGSGKLSIRVNDLEACSGRGLLSVDMAVVSGSESVIVVVVQEQCSDTDCTNKSGVSAD